MKKIILIGFLGILFLLGCQPNTSTTSTSTLTTTTVTPTTATLSSTTTSTTSPEPTNQQFDLRLFLDTAADTLEVEGELVYHNDDLDLNELYLILYPNAQNPGPDEYNAVFEYLRVEGEDVAYEVVGIDDTAIHIAMSETLLQGESITISFSYRFHYWSNDRMADYGNYYLTMFFYPCVALYTEEGWNIEPYSFRGETYFNTIGDYHVTINVPEAYQIACSAFSENETVVEGRKTVEYHLAEARDFSFCASSRYHVYSRTIAGIDFDIYAIRSLTTTEINESFGFLEHTFDLMERWIGDYYFDHFTLEYGYFYGMESSGVIYCSEEIQEGTVVHEIIHQWFYSMIGNDQANESFLDESLTTYAAALYYYDQYDMEGYNGYLDYRTSLRADFADRYQASLGVTLLRQVDEYGLDYGFLIYYHGPAMFRYYVEEYLDGNIEKMIDILHVYYLEYVKEIATIDAFLDLLERESGVAITKEWFMMQLLEFQDFDNYPI